MMVLEKDVLEILMPGFTHHVDIGQGEDAALAHERMEKSDHFGKIILAP